MSVLKKGNNYRIRPAAVVSVFEHISAQSSYQIQLETLKTQPQSALLANSQTLCSLAVTDPLCQTLPRLLGGAVNLPLFSLYAWQEKRKKSR